MASRSLRPVALINNGSESMEPKRLTEPILSAGETDASPAYLFRSQIAPTLHAISRDPNGANLPASEKGDWMIVGMIALGVREALPVPIAPEPVLRGLFADGYFVWHEGSNPKGTSQ